MHVKELQLTHFRNYEKLNISFDAGIHLFIGQNAQGKTNILESLYLLGLAKSHRTTKDREWIQWEQEYATIHGVIEKKYSTIPLELQISVKGKKAKVNRIEQRKLSDYVGTLNVVMFAPEDLEIVKGTPQVRRRFIDMEIGQINTTYLHNLAQYQKILQQRNMVLKDLQKSSKQRSMLPIFTEQLTQLAAKIILKRYTFLAKLQQWAATIHSQITEEKEQLTLEYLPSAATEASMSLEVLEQVLEEKFSKIEEQEIQRGTTLVGPHRDDLQFYVNAINVHTYGSQGQQRTTSLSIKLAEIELIHDEVGEYPILLLDDVLSELDDQRRSHLLGAIQGRVQTFVTNTSLEGVDQHILDQATLYHVSKGNINTFKNE